MSNLWWAFMGGIAPLLRDTSLKDFKPLLVHCGDFLQRNRGWETRLNGMQAAYEVAGMALNLYQLIFKQKWAVDLFLLLKKSFHDEYVFIMKPLHVVLSLRAYTAINSGQHECHVFCVLCSSGMKTTLIWHKPALWPMGLKCAITLTNTSSWPITKPTQPTEYLLK